MDTLKQLSPLHKCHSTLIEAVKGMYSEFVGARVITETPCLLRVAAWEDTLLWEET